MSNCLLAASPSWYCSRVSDCSEDGHFVFGAKNTLYRLNINQKEPSFTDQLVAHRERIVSLSVCHVPGHTNKCVSTSEDGKVIIWDLDSKTLIQEHTEHQGPPTVVHWSPVDPNLIVSGDDKGVIVCWHIVGNSTDLLSPESGHIFCLTCSPHNKDHVAIGYKSGNIILMDISRRGIVLERLRGHDEEIHSLCWSPVLGESLTNWLEESQIPVTGSLLASGSRDRTIKVWSTSDGRNVLTLKLPTNTGHKRDRYEDQNRSRAWLTLCWPKNRPRQFISSTYNGDLLLWDLTRSGKQKWETFSAMEVKGHNRIVFNISTLPPDLNVVCSISMDRQIVLWNLNTLEASNKVSTLGGFVYNIAVSQLNPNRVALGVGDNMIRVCNMDSPTHVLETVSLWQGIKSKVTSLSWHPVKEGQLAYGTDDGRVGLYDVLSQKPPLVSSTYHKRTVYVVTWGPPCPASGKETTSTAYVLFSCGDGTILQHDPYKLDKPAVDINKVISKQNNTPRCPLRSEISFKLDWSHVALGNEDGSVDVYSIPELHHKCSIQVHRKLVNVVRWHPEFTAQTGDSSSCKSWLAIASNEFFISVVDLQNILESSAEGKSAKQITESMCRLEGHSNRVTGLSWSTHQEAKMVSASYDGSAQVWDVKNVEPLANYRGHVGRLFCTHWSMTDPDVIYTGADDFSIHSWHISKQEHTIPPKGKEWTKKKKGKGKAKGTRDHEVSESSAALNYLQEQRTKGSSDLETLQQLLAAKKKELETQEKANRSDIENVDSDVHSTLEEINENIDDNEEREKPTLEALNEKEQLKSTGETSRFKVKPRPDSHRKVHDGTNNKRKRRERSVFPVFNTMETRGKSAVQQDTMDLASLIYSGKDSQGSSQLNQNQTHLGLFMDRNKLFQHLEKEEAHHHDHGNSEQILLLKLWQGDLGDNLRQAAARKQLSDWHLAMAPLVSPKLWRELCVEYAKQLEDDGSVHKAVSFYLNVHKVQDAIEVFLRHNMFRDAVSLALARLSSEDPMFEKLYTLWAEHLLKENSYEQAAQCYIALRNPTEAAGVLARRSDSQSLKAASYITLVSGELDSFKTLASRFVQECLTIGDWNSASEVLGWHDCLKSLALYTSTHELLHQEFEKLKVYASPVVDEPKYSVDIKVEGGVSALPKFLLDPKTNNSLSSWPVVTRNGQPFIHDILGYWCLQNKDNLSNDKLIHFIKELSDMGELKQASVSVKQVIQAVSLHVSIGLLWLLLCNKEEAAHWWSVAMSTCKETQHPELLIGLCKLLLPQGPEKFVEIQQHVTAIRLSTSESPIGTGPATPTILENSDGGKDDQRNSKSFCTSFDCMSAFYYHAVLLDSVTEENHSDSLEVNNEDLGNESNDDVCPGKSGGYTGSVSNVNISNDDKLTSEKLKLLSGKLLWPAQVKKLELQKSLQYIQKSMKGMISNHSTQKSDISESSAPLVEMNGNAELGRSLLTPPSICRSVSGEYLHMKPGNASFSNNSLASPKQSPRRLFSPEKSLRRRCDSDGYEEMMPCIEEDGSSVTGESSLDESMTQSGIMQTRIYTKAHNIFSTDMSESINSDIEKSPIHKDITKDTGTKRNEYDNGHGDMRKQPVDTRYCGDHISLSVLSTENQRVTSELHDVTCMMKSTPFPHPLESAKLLCQLLLKQPTEDKEMLHLVCQWASDNAFLSEHQLFFSTLSLEM